MNQEAAKNYQQSLIDAIRGAGRRPLFIGIDKHSGNFYPRGLNVFRRNLFMAASRALTISYPTIALLLGEPMLANMAQGFILNSTKSEYDWAAWGGDFPQWLSTHSIVNSHPYIVDCARLDWVVHTCNRGGDTVIDGQSLTLLETKDINNIFLKVSPNVCLIDSDFPIVSIYQAHKENPEQPDLEQIKLMLSQGQGEAALVSRTSLRTKVRKVGANKMFGLH